MLVACLAAAACSGSTQVTPGTTTTRTELVDGAGVRHELELTAGGGASVLVAAPAARVWAALPGAYEAVGLQGRVLGAAPPVFGVAGIGLRRRLGDTQLSQYLDCGARAGIANAGSYTITFSMRTELRADTDSTSRIATHVQASARPPAGSDPSVRCGSTQVLEQRLTAWVVQLLERQAPSR